MKRRYYHLVWAVTLCAAAGSSLAVPFGSDDDVLFARALWQQLLANHLLGPDAFYPTTYKGAAPHGKYIDTLDGFITVQGQRGRLLLSRNYDGDNLSKALVANRPEDHLAAVTVMYRREQGYDSEDSDWFWVKYSPDGELMNTSAGEPMAGRVAKGQAVGCIACHRAAPGGDMVFNNDHRRE